MGRPCQKLAWIWDWRRVGFGLAPHRLGVGAASACDWRRAGRAVNAMSAPEESGRLPPSFGLGEPCGASAYFLVSAQRVGQMPPRRVARGGIVLVANRLVDRDMLRLNLAQISEAFRVAAARRIDDL